MSEPGGSLTSNRTTRQMVRDLEHRSHLPKATPSTSAPASPTPQTELTDEDGGWPQKPQHARHQLGILRRFIGFWS